MIRQARRWTIAAPLVLMMVTGACAAGDVAEPDPTTATNAAESDAANVQSGGGAATTEPDLDRVETAIAPVGEVPTDLLDEILADATERTALDREALTVVAAEAVVWSDGSLGCPQKDLVYTQALVDGYRVVLDTGAEMLHYHASHAGHFGLCENPAVTPGGIGRVGGGDAGAPDH